MIDSIQRLVGYATSYDKHSGIITPESLETEFMNLTPLRLGTFYLFDNIGNYHKYTLSGITFVLLNKSLKYLWLLFITNDVCTLS